MLSLRKESVQEQPRPQPKVETLDDHVRYPIEPQDLYELTPDVAHRLGNELTKLFGYGKTPVTKFQYDQYKGLFLPGSSNLFLSNYRQDNGSFSLSFLGKEGAHEYLRFKNLPRFAFLRNKSDGDLRGIYLSECYSEDNPWANRTEKAYIKQ